MATANSTPATRQHPRKRLVASEAPPRYGIGDGVLSYRHGLPARERVTIDRAMAILGRALRVPGVMFNTPQAVRDYLCLALAAEAHECFAVLYLDAQHRLIAFETHFLGTLTQTSVYPREIVTAALRHRAAAVVLAHNHPSGAAKPSHADEMLTQTLKQTLGLVDVRVLDHFIVAGCEATSMAELGLT